MTQTAKRAENPYLSVDSARFAVCARAASAFFCVLISACIPVTRPTVKIALIAPFEGRYREVGYEVIYAVRLAVREVNWAGGLEGHSVELLALDDGGDPTQAEVQARKAAVDPQVLGAIGHWLEATTRAAAPAYAEAGLPILATTADAKLPALAFRLWPSEAQLREALPEAQHCPAACDSLEDLQWLMDASASGLAPIAGPPLWGTQQFSALAGEAAEGVYVVLPAPLPADADDAGFADRYRALSNGVEPHAFAVLAYDAAQVLLAALAGDIRAHGSATRAGVAQALAASDHQGLSGQIRFDAQGNWVQARGWVYQWKDGRLDAMGFSEAQVISEEYADYQERRSTQKRAE